MRFSRFQTHRSLWARLIELNVPQFGSLEEVFKSELEVERWCRPADTVEMGWDVYMKRH